MNNDQFTEARKVADRAYVYGIELVDDPIVGVGAVEILKSKGEIKAKISPVDEKRNRWWIDRGRSL